MALSYSSFRSKFDEICRKNRSAGRPFAEISKTQKPCLCRERAVSLLLMCSRLSVYLSLFLCICFSICLFVRMSFYLSVCLSFLLAFCIFVFINLPVCPSVLIPACLCQGRVVSLFKMCGRLSFCPFCLSIFLSICLSICLSFFLMSFYLSFCHTAFLSKEEPLVYL